MGFSCRKMLRDSPLQREKRRPLSDRAADISRIFVGETIALRAQIVDYHLIVVPRGEYLGLTAVVTEAKYIANVLRFHHGGFPQTLYRLLHSP